MRNNDIDTYRKLYSKTQANVKSGDLSRFKAFYERVRGEPWREGKNSQRRANKGSEGQGTSITHSNIR